MGVGGWRCFGETIYAKRFSIEVTCDHFIGNTPMDPSDEDEFFVHRVWKFDNFSATQILREINLSFLALILEAFSTVTLYKVT